MFNTDEHEMETVQLQNRALQRPFGILLVFVSCAQTPAQAPNPNDTPDAGWEGADMDTRAAPADVGEACESDCDQGCDSDDDCSAGAICTAQACVEGCRFDGACDDGYICEDADCVPGCRDPADCEAGFTCRARQCVFEGCVNDSECGAGFACDEGECVDVGAVACTTSEDCGYRWHCLSTGICHDRECRSHPDCSPADWCRHGVCVDRTGERGQLRFSRVRAPAIDGHTTGEVKTYGAGGALFDMDGDGDDDLMLGAYEFDTDSPPCIYENVSTPGEIEFAPVEGLCGWSFGQAITGGGIDVDGDGREEFLLLGLEVIRLLRFHPEPAVIELRDAIPRGNPRRVCMAGAYAATDFDHDGRIDILIGCQSLKIPRSAEQVNIALRQTEEGGFELWDVPGYEALSDDGVTLALGVIDADQDGLLDVVIVNDTFVESGGDTNHLRTGTLAYRCAPGATCAFDQRTFGEGTRAWGSYMGVGNVRIGGAGDHLYITDWGPNRLLRSDGRELRDLAAEYRVDLGTNLGLPIFAWSALVDDFDRNGLDDLLVTQGSASPDQFGGYRNHRDVLLLQTGDGDFIAQDREVGLDESTHEDSLHDLRVFSSRGAVKADLDGDGYLDFIVTGLEGHTKIFSETPTVDNAPNRCTLIPVPAIVPGHAVGYAVRPSWSQDWHRRDMQGNPRFGAARGVLTSHPRGTLRFPSGAEVQFDCTEDRRQIVAEPAWVDVRLDDGELRITLDTPWLEAPPTLEVAARSDGGGVRISSTERDGETWSTALDTHERAVMLKLNGKWIARWWPL